MSPISVLGPAGSLVGLINATGILSKELYDLARGVRAARKDIRKFARRLSMFAWSSNEACSCLLRHYTNDTGLDTISNAKKKRFLTRAEESAREILKDVKNIAPRIMSMEPSGIELSLISKFKWYQRKSEVRDLTLEMSALQYSLSLVMSTVNYEVQIQQGADPEALAITMMQINNFMEGGEVIASKVEKLAGAQRDTDQTLQRLTLLLDNVMNVADRQLEVADEAREATGLYEPGRWVFKKEADPTVRFDTGRKRSATGTHPQGRPSIIIRPQERRTRSPRPPRPPNESTPINIPRPPEASSSRGVETPIIFIENDQSAQPPATRSPQGAALTYFFAPGDSDDYDEIDGYISKGMGRNSKSSGRTIMARQYPNFFVNAMSRAMAEQLGLNVTVLTNEYIVETQPVVGSTQPAANRTVGEVRFVWHTPTDILWVTCTVFEQDIVPGVPLALGKPYVRMVETAGGVVRGESSRAGEAS